MTDNQILILLTLSIGAWGLLKILAYKKVMKEAEKEAEKDERRAELEKRIMDTINKAIERHG